MCNCDSDHMLVKIKIRERSVNVTLGNFHRRKHWNLNQFKDPNKLSKFKVICNEKMRNKLRFADNEERTEEVNEVCHIERSWRGVKSAALMAAEEVIREKTKTRAAELFDDKCKEALRIRNDYRLTMLQRTTRQTTSDYKYLRVLRK